MSNLSDKFIQSGLSRFLNTTNGRILRIIAGLIFLVVGIIFSGHVLGIISIVWSLFPLSAGIFNLCWVSAALGGPLSGTKIKAIQEG